MEKSKSQNKATKNAAQTNNAAKSKAPSANARAKATKGTSDCSDCK